MEVETINTGCQIVKDLLPLYVEKLTSPVSNQLIEGHLEYCEQCREKIRAMTEEVASSLQPEPAARDKTGRKLVRRIRLQVWLTAAALLVILAVNLSILWGEGIRFSTQALIRSTYPLVGEAEIVAKDTFGGRKLIIYDDGFVFGFHTYNRILGLYIPRAAAHKYAIESRPFEVVASNDGDDYIAVVKSANPDFKYFVAGAGVTLPATVEEARQHPDKYLVAEAEGGFAWLVKEGNVLMGELSIGAYDSQGNLATQRRESFWEFNWEVEPDGGQGT